MSILDLNPPAGARIRVISDWHLGHERCEVPDEAAMLQAVENVDILISAGDLAETRPNEWQERGLAARERFRDLCRERGVQLIEIAGNHDPDVAPLLLKLWGGRVVIMHGHALYKEVAPWSWEYLHNKEKCRTCIRSFADADTNLLSRLELSRAMSQLTPPIMRRAIRNPYLRGLLHCFWPPQRPLGIVLCWLFCGIRAERFARRYFPEAKTLILGHFHRGLAKRFGARRIYNTGAWFKHATPYAVDLMNGEVKHYGRLA